MDEDISDLDELKREIEENDVIKNLNEFVEEL